MGEKEKEMISEDRLYFPQRLLVQFLEDRTGKPVPRIAVTLTVYARAKNNYHLGPTLSGLDGQTLITSNWVEEAVEYIRNTSLMDYVTPMDQCFSEVSINVMSADEIERAVSAMRLYGVENGSQDIAHTLADLQNSSNKAYLPTETKLILNDPNEVTRSIQIRLRKL